MNVDHHPRFDSWLTSQSADLDLYGELIALITALEDLGAELLVGYDECHPVVTSPYLYALRRTPPTTTTPYATNPPVIRMLFGLVVPTSNEQTSNDTGDTASQDAGIGSSSGETAVMVVGGDKTTLGNLWYPPHIAEAHKRLREYALRTNTTPLKVRNQR